MTADKLTIAQNQHSRNFEDHVRTSENDMVCLEEKKKVCYNFL